MGWHPPHPGLTIRSKVFNEIGMFDINFPLSADYEFMLRLFRQKKFSTFYLEEVLVKMLTGGVSSSVNGIFRGVIQIYNAHIKNGDNRLKVVFILFKRYVTKIMQILFK